MVSGQSTQIELGGRRLTFETGRVAKQAEKVSKALLPYADRELS